ncbi:MAG TPA: DUF362 domain-containing protein [Candidatus Paceibacterota bacterium]|nr:DUF362 domain-containing protein [Verrucomicrobiota bacterium]HRZ46081.1 DUF362 domain-containing protein [Candidatus Paceibacterota bacterium]HRZ93654.1 DUF362 domain-containing protein [Candidatus Paceibacterota bacterium]
MKRIPGTSIRTLALLAAASVACGLGQPQAAEPVPLEPVGDGCGIHPGRVVWAHDPDATDWRGPGDGHWWEHAHTRQDRVDAMMAQAVQALSGEATTAASWDRLFRYQNRRSGEGDAGYRAGEKIAIKVNFVGFIVGGGGVDPSTYSITKNPDYMNTAPQMIVALLRQLVREAGVAEADISVGDTLALFPNEYYDIIHREFPGVRCVDQAGRFGRHRAAPSSVPVYWSARPAGCATDTVPDWFAEAKYIVNLANLKAHQGTGITLCAKNHFGSLIRTPVQKGYYELHKASFSAGEGIYRPLVDLMGHRHIGGKTVLYLVDGLFTAIHPKDLEPRRWLAPPFNGDWASSLLASQDPVAIDSVGLDFLRIEYAEARKAGVDDFLHEAARADRPPSGTFYDPDHATPQRRLPSLGVHEHWNNPVDRQYSRNLGRKQGIELVAVRPAAPPR